MERPFDFEKKLEVVHKPGRINRERMSSLSGTTVTNEWKIAANAELGEVLKNAVFDLQDYFKTSMEIELDVEISGKSDAKTIFIGVDDSLDERSFSIKVSDKIEIYGKDERYAAQGIYALEDEMNLNEAPIAEPGVKTMKCRFSVREIFTGMRLGKYTDKHLSMLAHAGFNAIPVGTRDVIESQERCDEVNDIINRAKKFGIDVYTTSTFKNLYHPDDEKAYEYYDSTYGKLFELCPGIKGIQIVGECCEFPSKDPRTTGKTWRESLDDEKSSPGWFPCSDYPQFVSMLRDVIKAHSPEAEFIFFTYNWGYETEELRAELLRKVPTDITMKATFEMFEKVDISPEIQEVTTDYTLWQIGPGKYFSSEAKIARERGLRMFAKTNSAGNTWDIGGTPYLPAPQRWIKRWQAVTDAQDNYKLDGIEESHTYGFWPSILPELAKYAFMCPRPDMNELLKKLIIRDCGEENVDGMLEVYELFSKGMEHCVSTNEDQFGPARLGPSYPLFFKNWELVPKGPESRRDVNYEGYPVYKYNLDREEKLLYELQEYREMARLFNEGAEKLNVIISKMDAKKGKALEELWQVAKFIGNTATTIHHVKRWHYLKGKLGVYVDARAVWCGGRKNMPDAEPAKKPLIPAKNPKGIVLELIDILKREIANAEDTIPLVEANSRLGYEQEYDYAAAPEQIRWKIQMAEKTLKEELLPLLDSIK